MKAMLIAFKKVLDDFEKRQKRSDGAYGAIQGFTSYLANSIDGFIGTTNETFYSFLGGNNDPDKETLNKLRPGDNIETNDMFEYIFGGYGRNTRLDRKNFGDAFIQFGLDVEGIGNPFGRASGSPAGTTPIKSDTFGIWDRQYTGILRNSDGSPFGFKYKNVRGEGLSKRTTDSLNKAIQDSNNYWNTQYKK